jgi:hypothetical protein
MPKFIIEREIPGAGNLDAQQLKDIATYMNTVTNSMPNMQWIQSYVTGDKVYCVYNAPSSDACKEHAEKGGFACNLVSHISSIIDPVTAE